MDLNYLIVRNGNEKMLKKLLHLLKKIFKFCGFACYWKVLKIRTYWTLLKKYWKILILSEPSIEKVLIIEHYWKINKTFSLLYCIVLYCIEPRRRCLLHTQKNMSFVQHTQKNTSFVQHTQKSTKTDFCTGYSKKHIICTARKKNKKHLYCILKKAL